MAGAEAQTTEQSIAKEGTNRTFPKYFTSKVVKGFGRGSKDLGCPTANMDIDRSENPNEEAKAMQKFCDHPDSEGVYFGWAQVIQDGVDRGVYKTALSIGKNPTYDDVHFYPNKKMLMTNYQKINVRACTLEPWILHDYGCDFYGAELRLIICSFSRGQIAFKGEDWLDQLIAAIKNDGTECEDFLDKPEWAKYKEDPYFVKT